MRNAALTTVCLGLLLTACTSAIGSAESGTVTSVPATAAPRISPPERPASVAVAGSMLNPAVTQGTIGRTICVRGWTRTIRPKLPTRHGYENDHIVSLELGGAPKDPSNLRFVPLTRARRDDVLENELHREVCAHPPQISLAQAREEIVAAKVGE